VKLQRGRICELILVELVLVEILEKCGAKSLIGEFLEKTDELLL